MATYTVTTTLDVVASGDGVLPLREALALADSDLGATREDGVDVVVEVYCHRVWKSDGNHSTQKRREPQRGSAAPDLCAPAQVLNDAIQRHAGQAANSVTQFNLLTDNDRARILAFLNSL